MRKVNHKLRDQACAAQVRTGYFSQAALLTPRGALIRISKDIVYSCRGRSGITGRRSTIKVDHVLPGKSRRLGIQYHDGKPRFRLSDRDKRYIEDRFSSDMEALYLENRLQIRLIGIDIYEFLLPERDPEIAWLGRGGWRSVFMWDVIPVPNS